MSEGKTKLLGHRGEALAAAELRRRGWKVLAVRYRSRFGEVDLITAIGKHLSFIRVELRTGERFAFGREVADRRKQACLHATAELYLAEHLEKACQPRFDVAETYAPQGTTTHHPRVTWLENVFQREFQMEQYAVDLLDGCCDAVFLRYLSGGGLRWNDGHADLGRMGKYRRYAQLFALLRESGPTPARDPNEKIHRELFLEEYALFEQEMAANADLAALRRTDAEAGATFRSRRRAVFLLVERVELLDRSPEQLGEAHAMGVRVVSPTWNHVSALPGTNAEEPERGLTHQGRTSAHKTERLGILMDMSHLSDPGFWDVAEELNGPFSASHLNARVVFSHPRDLTDEQFTAITNRNGVAGLNLYANFLGGRANLDIAIAHPEYWLELEDERTVALDGDLDGCSSLSEGITGIQDLDRPWEWLLQRNYSEALMHVLFFENPTRVVSEVCTI